MKKILIPVDFSDASANACRYALELAAQWNSEIRLFHAIFNPMLEQAVASYGMYTASLAAATPTTEMETLAQKNLDKQLEALQNRAKENGWEVSISGQCLKGEPEFSIREEVDTYQPDLVVLGIKRRTVIGRLFWGTIATPLIKKISAPILTVPEDCQLEVPPQIAYASDFDQTDTEVFATIYKAFQPWAPQYYCVHVSDPMDGIVLAEQLDLMPKMLEAHLGESYPKEQIQYDAEVGQKLANTLNTYIEKEGITMLAVNTHKRKFMERLFNPSQTQKLVFHTRVPLLVYHGSV